MRQPAQEIPAQTHAGMTKEVHTGMTEIFSDDDGVILAGWQDSLAVQRLYLFPSSRNLRSKYPGSPYMLLWFFTYPVVLRFPSYCA
ncbi:hypothetical protein C6Y40_18745 [Alteromonas alba]|uniref:Uncharacterized protein n=1 Tax=Alteromonas alba TaxID=2079529 RepID=A0A2S9V685_9ALTE|nr:hypothetical protein C6Y40_18745 [Alteromonas alba]